MSPSMGTWRETVVAWPMASRRHTGVVLGVVVALAPPDKKL